MIFLNAVFLVSGENMQIIVTHNGSDFDAIASLVAGTLIYPGALPVLPGNLNPNVKGFLSIHKNLFHFYSPKEIEMEQVKSLVVVDTNSWRRLDGVSALKKRDDLEIIQWDHHIEGDIKADIQYCEEIGSTITLMIRQLEKERKILTPIQATLFLAGIYEDTGNLTFPSTKPEDARAVAYLLERKADLTLLKSFITHSYGEKHRDILFKMIKDASREKLNGFMISISSIRIEGHINNLSMVVQMYREILNVDAAFGIFEDKERGRCMVIGRSDVGELNMGTIMRSMGGGGHPGAGSALLKKVNIDIIEKMIRELVEGNQYSTAKLADIMSYPVVSVTPDTTIDDVAMVLRDNGCTGVPVVDENEVMVGVISRNDFRKIRKNSQMKSPVKAYMSRKVISIDPDKSPVDAAKIMIKHDIGRVPVVRDGKIIGIVTRADAMTYFYDLLPD